MPRVGFGALLPTILVIGALAVLVACALVFGERAVPAAQVWAALTHPQPNLIDHAVIVDVRLPRVLAGLCVGAALGVAGALMQALTRNPLASPSVGGLNTGATLGMLIGLWALPHPTALPLAATSFLGAALAAFCVFALAGGSSAGGTRWVLAGATVNLMLGAAVFAVVLHYQMTLELLFWLAGGLSGVLWSQVYLLLGLTALGNLGALLLGKSLDVLAVGDIAAEGLGVSSGRLRRKGLLVVVLLAGGAVSVAGPMAFVGLVAPHVARGLGVRRARAAILASAAAGAALVVGADLLIRTALANYDLPAGALTAPIGALVLAAAAFRRGRRRL